MGLVFRGQPPPVDSPQAIDEVLPLLLPESTTTYTWHYMAASQLSYSAVDFDS